jgi:hypothetical protein
MKVGTLSCQRKNVYPEHYTLAFAFFIIPYPHRYWYSLRSTFPCATIGSDTGLPSSVYITEWVRIRLSTGGAMVAYFHIPKELSYPLPFWLEPTNLFWLIRPNDLYQRFTYVIHTIHSHIL